MTPVVAYHPYLFVALELDAEWSRKREYQVSDCSHPLETTFRKVIRICEERRAGGSEVGKAYAKAAGATVVPPLADYLLRPIFQLPAGHADCLALILLDDFDSVHHLAAHSRTIEDLTLAFCPTVASLGLSGYPFLRDPHCLWPNELAENDSPAQARVLSLPAVVTLSKFKLDGICNLEYGLLFKRAIFRAAAVRCQEALEALKVSGAHDGLVTSEDIKATRVCFLCTQGQEEICLLVTSPNPIINIGLSAAVRTLSLADLLVDTSDQPTELLRDLLGRHEKDVPSGRNGYQHGSLHRKLLGEGPAVSTAIPVFRWSRSLLAFGIDVEAPNLFPHCGLSGWVGVDYDFQLAPGLDASLDAHMCLKANPNVPNAGDIPAGWHFGEVGASDHRFSPGTPRKLVSTLDAVNHICQCVNTTVERNRQGRQSGLVGISTTFHVPIFASQPFRYEHYIQESPLDRHLPAAGSTMWGGAPSLDGISMQTLLEVPKQYGLPRALRRSIEALFNNFIIAIYNPNLFDLVADLYDSFATLYQVLTDALPKTLCLPDGGYLPIDGARALGVARYATALKNAVERRLDLAYPDATVRNMSVQFPGSFAQILFSADAPLKASLGVLKYHIRSAHNVEGTSKNQKIAPLAGVGVITETTLEPGIRTFDLVLGLKSDEQKRSPRLSFLHMDLDHLFHPGSFLDCVHEAFHLVFDQLFWKEPHGVAMDAGKRLAYDEPYTRERVEETWVQLGCFLFFAPDKPRKLLHYLVGKYALDMRSGGPDRHTVVRHFAEHVCRLIIATTAVERLAHSVDSGAVTAPNLAECRQMLIDRLDVLLRLFPETAYMNPDDLGLAREAVMQHLEVFWQEARLDYYLPVMWKVALTQFYQPLCKDLHDFDAACRHQYAESLQQLESGWAITRHGAGGAYVDSVTGTAILLGGYLTRFDEVTNSEQRLHLERDNGGIVRFENAAYADYLIDRGAAQRFVLNPVARGQRLQHQIALIESFWDFSSHFRARRVFALLEEGAAQNEPLKPSSL